VINAWETGRSPAVEVALVEVSEPVELRARLHAMGSTSASCTRTTFADPDVGRTRDMMHAWSRDQPVRVLGWSTG